MSHPSKQRDVVLQGLGSPAGRQVQIKHSPRQRFDTDTLLALHGSVLPATKYITQTRYGQNISVNMRINPCNFNTINHRLIGMAFETEEPDLLKWR